MKKKLQIIGCFWDGPGFTVELYEPFGGEIEIDESGEFTGSTIGPYGKATVTGKLGKTQLEFHEIYEESGVRQHCLLQSSPHGGWLGIFQPDQADEESTCCGQIACSIHSG